MKVLRALFPPIKAGGLCLVGYLGRRECLHRVLCGWVFLFCSLSLAKETSFMGPLRVVDPTKAGWQTHSGWDSFHHQVRQSKALGIKSLSTDTWWGLVQDENPAQFNWEYYDRAFSEIERGGLQIDALLSAHQCGGNIGDGDVYIPLPKFIREKIRNEKLGYVSEAGHHSLEVVSVWGTPSVLEDLRRFWTAFRDRYGSRPERFSRIIIGMGPAGEVVYPSYHTHDRLNGVLHAHVPGRGTLQASSDLAQQDLRRFLKIKYGSIERLNLAWGKSYRSFDQVVMLTSSDEVTAFFKEGRQYTQQGQDYFSWYHGSLLADAYAKARVATEVFHAPDSPFRKVELSLKIPGIHWGFSERLPQLTAGLISTESARFEETLSPSARQPQNWTTPLGNGYENLFTQIFEPLRREFPHSKWSGIFTCGEMSNCRHTCVNGSNHDCHCDMPGLRSGASELVRGVGILAEKWRVPFHLENALESSLANTMALSTLEHHLSLPGFRGTSLLRMEQALKSPSALAFLSRIQGRAEPESSRPNNGEASCPNEILMLNPEANAAVGVAVP